MTEENIKEETPDAPEICTRCGNYLPQFYRIIGTKECAAFGNCKGVKGNRCGAFTRRIDAPKPWGRKSAEGLEIQALSTL